MKYYKEELDIKSEMVNDLDIMFNDAVENFMSTNDNYKDIWDLYNKKKDQRFDDILKQEENKNNTTNVVKIDKSKIKEENKNTNKEQTFEFIIDEKNNIHDNKNNMLKSIYRDIVKKSHPDKITHLSEEEKLKRISIYKDATENYKKDKIAHLIYNAYELDINVDITDKKLLNRFKQSIKEMKKKSSFLEQTFTWKWYNSDEKNKNFLVETFVKQQIVKKFH